MASNEKIKCTDCGNLRRPEDYYASTSPFHQHTGKLHVCKFCIWRYVEKNKDNLDLIKDALRRIDRPFQQELWIASKQEAEKAGKDIFKIYMKNLGLKQNRELTWADSDYELRTIKNTNDELEVLDESDALSTDKELIRRWGRGYSQSDIEYLENFYTDYAHTYATDTPVQINLYRNIAKVHLQAEKELSQNNTKNFKDLMELSSKLHNDGNIKPIQSTGANDDKGLSTYGLWIKTVEQDEPCEYFKDKPLYEDYDKFQKYWEKWFIRPFKNIFNITKDFNVRDDD